MKYLSLYSLLFFLLALCCCVPKQNALPLPVTYNFCNTLPDGYAYEIASNPGILFRGMCLGAGAVVSLVIIANNHIPAGIAGAACLMGATYVGTSLIHNDDEDEDF